MKEIARKKEFTNFYYETQKGPTVISVDPTKTILLLVDLQNEFANRDFGEALEFKEMGEWDRYIPFHERLENIVVPNNQKLLKFFRENDMVVSYGRIACIRDDGEDRSPVQKTEGWNGIFVPEGTYGAEIIDALAPMKNEMVISKTTDSVAHGTSYVHKIRNMGIKTVVVTGIVTDECVASTIRSLADEGFDIICVEDACASGNMELHNAELKIMNNIYCDVLSTDETIEVIESCFEE